MDNKLTKSTNPKDVLGVKKVPFQYIPSAALLELGRAMRDGVRPRPNLPGGYGPHNWAESAVDAMVYYDAAQRHLLNWFCGQDRDPVSRAHELGHVMACCAIIIDAEYRDMLLDNRPPPNTEVIEQLAVPDPFAPDWMKEEKK